MCLDSRCRNEITQIIEDRGDAFASEWEGFNIECGDRETGAWRWERKDAFLIDLVRKEGGEEREDAWEQVVMFDDVARDGRDSKELDSKILDTRLNLTVNE